MIERRTLTIGVAGFLVTVAIALDGRNLFGSTAKDESFPVINEPAESGRNAYWVCKNSDTKERMYKISYDGGDYIREGYYDKNGQAIEVHTPLGYGAVNDTGTEVKLEDCIRTTEDYFKSHVKAE